ncbi:hypothetical protein E3A20_27680 [Planctomyces bekefii]|uniref:Uncharacterized protein n=1 Tax=Planctomyces bekefii TaxID=1653850 RepID=A0A5C6M1Q4_9PLAN|nr:hypothetical protein E3A20_27680 [Planctomyces bekefii]
MDRVFCWLNRFWAAGVSQVNQHMSEPGVFGDLQLDSGVVLTRRGLIHALGAGAGSIGLARPLSDAGESGLLPFAPRAWRLIHLF